MIKIFKVNSKLMNYLHYECRMLSRKILVVKHGNQNYNVFYEIKFGKQKNSMK